MRVLMCVLMRIEIETGVIDRSWWIIVFWEIAAGLVI